MAANKATSTRGLPSFGSQVSRSVVRHSRLWTVAILALMAFNVFAGLGSARVDDSDEARYGVSSHEMLNGGSWLVPTYAGKCETWNLKPPLGYWIQALSLAAFGQSALALRLPSALSALAVVFVTMELARRWLGRAEALLAGAVLATAFGFLGHHAARSGDLDAMLSLLVIAAMARLSRFGEGRSRGLDLGLICGAIFLLKSFAVLPVLGVAAVFLAVRGERRAWRGLGISLLILAAVVGLWAVARVRADGSDFFLRQMVNEDLLARSIHSIDRSRGHSLTYLDKLLDRFAPWPIPLAAAGMLAWRDRRDRRTGRRADRALALLVLWAAIPFLLFSIARTHHHWYLLPIYPALAMLTAVSLRSLGRRAGTRWGPPAFVVAIVVALAFCETRVLLQSLGRDRAPESQRFLASLGRLKQEERQPLAAAFPLSHSERFLLEVVAGFRVREMGDGATGNEPPAATAEWSLRSLSSRGGDTVDFCSEGSTLAAGEGYLLCSGSAAGERVSRRESAPATFPAARTK